MRLLLLGGAFLVAGCGGQLPVCSDAPLAGGCSHVEGTWAIESSQSTSRCGAATFAGTLNLTRNDGAITGDVGGIKVAGTVFESGEFELFTTGEGEGFRVTGNHVPGKNSELGDQLRGSVTFPSVDESCEGRWAFVATRR